LRHIIRKHIVKTAMFGHHDFAENLRFGNVTGLMVKVTTLYWAKN